MTPAGAQASLAREAELEAASAALSPDALALLRTVVYASLFEYPLTLAEVRQTLIGTSRTETEIAALYRSSPTLRRCLELRDGWFFPRGRSDMLMTRRRRARATRALLERHARLLRLVAAVPFAGMVALSGSAAMGNCEGRDGDLDLFIVTEGPHAWGVTLTIVLLARLLRRRDLVCVNFVVSDSALRLEQQDLFAANQVIHLRPLTGLETYGRFVDANAFVRRWYPGFAAAPAPLSGLAPGPILAAFKRAAEAVLGLGIAGMYERACRAVYGRYLRRRVRTWHSPEHVRLQDECVKLHTNSHRQSILTRFEAEVGRTLAQS